MKTVVWPVVNFAKKVMWRERLVKTVALCSEQGSRGQEPGSIEMAKKFVQLGNPFNKVLGEKCVWFFFFFFFNVLLKTMKFWPTQYILASLQVVWTWLSSSAFLLHEIFICKLEIKGDVKIRGNLYKMFRGKHGP